MYLVREVQGTSLKNKCIVLSFPSPLSYFFGSLETEGKNRRKLWKGKTSQNLTVLALI